MDRPIATVQSASGNHEMSYEHCRELCLFHTRRERMAMMPNLHDVAHNSDGMRATGGESRRRAQRTRPRLGNTGASIAQTDRVASGRPTGITQGYDGIVCSDKDTRAYGRF
jgi:hypothetical protein